MIEQLFQYADLNLRITIINAPHTPMRSDVSLVHYLSLEIAKWSTQGRPLKINFNLQIGCTLFTQSFYIRYTIYAVIRLILKIKYSVTNS